MTNVTDDSLRREQALQLERIRLALRKASRLSEVDSDTELAWNQLGVSGDAVTNVRQILHDIGTTLLRETRGQVLPPNSLDALGLLKNSLSAAPPPTLPLATRNLLHVALGPGTAATICALQDAGFQIVPSDTLPAVRCLARPEPLLSDVAILRTDRGPEWRLFADAALLALGHAPLNIRQLMTLWDSKCIFGPSRSTFHSRVAFFRAYDLTRERRFDAAWEQAEAFENPVSHTTTPLEKEVVNLRAYLILVRKGDTCLETAIRFLERISRSPIASQNLEFLKKRKLATLNERGPLENPYLAFKVDHGASKIEWRRAWMAARSDKNADLDQLSEVNAVYDQIITLERDDSDGTGHVFIVPLSKEFTSQSITKKSDQTASDLPRMPIFRGDEQVSEVLQKLRHTALHELLAALDELVYVKEFSPE